MRWDEAFVQRLPVADPLHMDEVRGDLPHGLAIDEKEGRGRRAHVPPLDDFDKLASKLEFATCSWRPATSIPHGNAGLERREDVYS